MANPKHKIEREEIMSFLLGELEEAEDSQIKSMLLSDPTYSEAVEAAKSQLFAEYKSGRLSPVRSGRFERRLLPNLEEDKKNFEAMLARNEQMRATTESPEAAQPSAPAAPRAPTATASAGLAATATPAAPAASPAGGKKNGHMGKRVLAAVLALGVVAAVVLMGRSSEHVVGKATLSIFSVRGQSQVIVLPEADEVVLTLPVPDSVAAQEFSIILFHGDTQSALPAQRIDGVVQTTVHTAKLEVGRYDLELRSSDDIGVVGYYSFRK